MKPDAYYDSIFSIDYDLLKKKGYDKIIFDVDNTLMKYTEDMVSNDVKDLINTLKKKNITPIIMSNSNSKRINKVLKDLSIEGYVLSFKPLKRNYKKLLKKYNKDEIIFIGDQFMTDVLGAKRNKLKVILVDRLDYTEPIFTKFWRFFENILVNDLEKNNEFKRYNYYDNL